MSKVYDVIILGGGPAGLSAGLYAGRAKMDALIIEKGKPGGQIATTNEVANVPCAVPDATGPSLIARLLEQVNSFGAEMVKDEIKSVDLQGPVKTIKGKDTEYKGKTVIVATGAKPRTLNVPGEKELTGKGVTYCATCDAEFFTDMEAFVVGGGDSAIEEAMFVAKFARKVTVLVREDYLMCAKSIAEKVKQYDKISIVFNTEIQRIDGDGMVESMVIKNNQTGETREIHGDEEDGTFGIFIFAGYIPQTGLFEKQLDMDYNYIKSDENMNTNLEGVFVAGDCRVKRLRQVITAASDGAIAAVEAEKYVENLD